MTPAIILIRPQLGENIGAAARVMANFGLNDLRLVAPRDGWPNPKAADMAARALYILDNAVVHDHAAPAVAEAQFVLATTARERAVARPVFTPLQAMRETRERLRSGQRVAVLFGPERTGLENEEVALADAVLTIPTSATYPSLNLAQAVAVVAYAWMAQTENVENGIPHASADMPAPRGELLGLFAQLEAALDDVNFWRVAEKKEAMWRNIRAGLMRAGFSPHEVQTWRGIIRALHNESP
jgi:tRNA/rRNA methyltransferase